MGSKVLALRSSLWMYLVRKDFILMGFIINIKNLECSQQKCWISLLYWEIGRFGSNGFSSSTNPVTHSTICIKVLLCARHISRHSENDRTKLGKNQLRIRGCFYIQAHVLYFITAPAAVHILHTRPTVLVYFNGLIPVNICVCDACNTLSVYTYTPIL